MNDQQNENTNFPTHQQPLTEESICPKVALSEIIGDPIVFLEQLFFMIEDIGLNLDKYLLDHICYRVSTAEEYKTKKDDLTDHGALLAESIVNGRYISTFKLKEPITFRNRKIYLIELPSPKEEKSYKTGLEHAEFVTKEPLQKIIDRYPQYAFEAFGIHKKTNPDITLKLGEFCIRFHNQTLEDVIKEERGHRANNNHKNNNHRNNNHKNNNNHKKNHVHKKNHRK